MKRYMKLGAMSLGLAASTVSVAGDCTSFRVTLVNETAQSYTQVDTQASDGGRVVPGTGVSLLANSVQTLLFRPNVSGARAMKGSVAFLSHQPPAQLSAIGLVVPELFTIDVTIGERYWTHCDRRAVTVSLSRRARAHLVGETQDGVELIIGENP